MDNKSDSKQPNIKNNLTNTALDEIRPKFQGKKKQDVDTARKAVKGELSDNEQRASSIGVSSGNAATVKQLEANMGNLFTGRGKSKINNKKSRFKISNFTATGAILLIIGIFVVATIIISRPLLTIGAIDFNLQDSLGFTATAEILKKQAMYISGNQLSDGEVPDVWAGDLAEHGIKVGQVTLAGDFVRTNVYVANIEQLKDLAVLGHFETTPSEGQLAVLYDDQVIKADDFVATVESNLKLFADFSDALDISARYYYSNEVSQVYSDMGLSRSAFVEWTDSGDAKKNQESFNEMAAAMLDNRSNLELFAAEGKDNNESGEEQTESAPGLQVSGATEASSIVSEVASSVRGSDATSRAAQLLNTAISASEPYLAASTFMMIEEPIQQARIEGTGPVNELMNLLNTETEVSYTDVTTGETKTKKASIMTTGNFVSAISGGKFSKGEAVNFARDRALVATKMNDNGIIRDTTVSSSGQSSSSILMKLFGFGSADRDKLSVLDDSVSLAMVQKNSDVVASEIGGNRAVEGGSFLSNTINTRVIGAMPSDEATIAEYHQEVKDVMARKAEAERATRSPFDITSPYTFMGSIVHSLSNAVARNRVSGGSLTNSIIGVVADVTNNSTKQIWSSAIADGRDDSYAMTFGDYCNTAKSAANVEADIYCTPHTTISTGYMKNKLSDWRNELGDNISENGSVNEDANVDYKLSDFITNGMDRWATIGVQSADVCERKKGIIGFIADALGLSTACAGVDSDVATGARNTISAANSQSGTVQKYAGYVLFDRVSALLNNSVSKVSEYRESYYARYPLDNSRAGRIARISGMSKADAETALAYADYLTVIANYNPDGRFQFGAMPGLQSGRKSLFDHANEISINLYMMWHGKTEYADLRSKTQVA